MIERLRPLPSASTLRLIAFDLDGTLIDSRADLVAAVNATLTHLGRHPLPDAVIASYIGDGVHMLVRRALGDPEHEAIVTEAVTFFLGYYRIHKLDHTYVYEGALDAMAAIARALPQSRLAILTNKPIRPSEEICAALQLAPHCFRIYGGNSFETKKPDPLGLETLMREAGATPEQTLMIGDSDVDVLTARNAGASVIGCRFGLAPHSLADAPPDCLVDTPFEWLEALGIPQNTGRANPYN
ncbi:MAG: HAD-IA family hydrolase [Acidobacteriaceae bacterium]|jgi:phosphoglycolate phosphatase